MTDLTELPASYELVRRESPTAREAREAREEAAWEHGQVLRFEDEDEGDGGLEPLPRDVATALASGVVELVEQRSEPARFEEYATRSGLVQVAGRYYDERQYPDIVQPSAAPTSASYACRGEFLAAAARWLDELERRPHFCVFAQYVALLANARELLKEAGANPGAALVELEEHLFALAVGWFPA